MLPSFINLLPTFIIESKLFYVIIIDEHGHYVYANNLFKNAICIEETNPMIDINSLNYIHNEDRELWVNTLKVCKQNIGASEKITIRKKNNIFNTYNYTKWEISKISSIESTPAYFLGIGYDTSEALLQRRKAQQFAYQLDSIINNMTDGFFVVGNSWEILKVNHVIEKIFNMNKENLLGKNYWEITKNLKIDTSLYAIMYPRAMVTQKQVTFEEYNNITQQWFLISAYPSSKGLMVFYRNITQQKNTIEQLQDSERKLKAILNSTTDNNILISPDYKILSFNKVAEENTWRFMQKRLKEGNSMLEYTVENTKEDFMNNFQKALDGELVHIEKEISFDGKQSFWFALSYVPVYENNQLFGVAFNSTNIDVRKRAELKVTEQNEDLMSIAWLQSHEVRKPVANILGLVDLLKEETNSEYIQYLEQSAEELDKIVRDIVSLTNTIR